MQETIRFFFVFLVYTFALFGLSVALTGCESAKYYECLARDRTAHPCN